MARRVGPDAVPEGPFAGGGRRLFAALVQGPSMSPTLRHGDAVLVWRTSRVRPGDVVVARFAGVAGPVVKRAVRAQGGGWWVQGDNELVRDDSRRYGAATVLGRVVLRWWPRPGLLRRAG
jgi:phage repressor protein C with HTH and peptisase S24 domain